MVKRFIHKFIAVLILLSGTGCSIHTEIDSAEIMYFILIDRFVDGDPTNNMGYTPDSYLLYDGKNPQALKHYQGGDLAGITQSLDSIKALGFTMIWISPFLDNSNTDYVGWWPYHGYHPIDFYKVDEHYGSLEDLKLLVRTAHEKDLKIIFDMPFNQTAADHPWVEEEAKQKWFHYDPNRQPYEISNWFDQVQIERGELHGLPDLAQENPQVSDYLYDVSKYWIEETGCDGFRLDAVKHIPMDFWRDYNAKIKALAGPDFLLLGEVFWGEAERIGPYVELGFDLLFDIPGYYTIRNTFNKGGSIKDLSEFYQATEQVLGSTALATLIDNHDVPRFNVGLDKTSWQKQLLALGWLMTSPGLPVIYYGTEFGMQGYPTSDAHGEPQDYLNRKSYPLNPDVEQEYRRSQFTELTKLRHRYTAFSSGMFREIYKDWSVYAYLRFLPQERHLVVLNNAATEECLSIPIPEGVQINKVERIYGKAALRLEEAELRLHLPPNSLSVWQFNGLVDSSISTRVDFSDRLSEDYKKIRLFFLDPESAVTQLQVAGDFNNWTPQEYRGFRIGDTLIVEVPLKPGIYNYKFVLNGSTWLADPNAVEFSIDPYGGQNSVLRITAD